MGCRVSLKNRKTVGERQIVGVVAESQYFTEYRLIRSARKTLGIYIDPEGSVEVRAPQRLSQRIIRDFVADKTPWIESKLATFAVQEKPQPLSYQPGSVHYLLGQAHRLVINGEPGFAGNSSLPEIPLVVRQSDNDSIARALSRWQQAQAKAVFTARHQHWRDQLCEWRLPESQIRLRRMKRRWGSCSSKGDITLNTHLIRYPLHCIDAVVVHELCHLLEFNHSKRFYDLMDQAYPDWRSADAELRTPQCY